MSYQTEQKDAQKTFSHTFFISRRFSRNAAPRWRSRHPGWGGGSKQGCSASPVLARVWWGRTKLCEMWTQLSAQLSGSIWATRTAGCVYLILQGDWFCNFSRLTREGCGLLTVEVANFPLSYLNFTCNINCATMRISFKHSLVQCIVLFNCF